VQFRSAIEPAAEQSWVHHHSSISQSYQAFPSQWVNVQAQPQTHQMFAQQLPPNPYKRTATQLSYGSAAWPNTMTECQMAQQHFSAMPPRSQPSCSNFAAQPSAEITNAHIRFAQQHAAALERLRQMSADLQTANERIAKDSKAHADSIEAERQRHAEEMQRIRESSEKSQQALQDELASERKLTVCIHAFGVLHIHIALKRTACGVNLVTGSCMLEGASNVC
jgi:hypothetical protein